MREVLRRLPRLDRTGASLARRARGQGQTEGARTESVIGRAATIRQEDGRLTLDLTFRSDITARTVVGKAEDAWYPLGELEPTGAPGSYRASVDLAAMV